MLTQAGGIDGPGERRGRDDEPGRHGQAGDGHRREARTLAARDRDLPAGGVVEPDQLLHQSSTMATARTGAAVVPSHLIGNTDSLNPCDGSCSRFMRFSRCQ